ncbi:4-hydroxy-3-methylbut-2-enyl diphosphate reductase, partial [Parafrankia sp. FMc6]
EGHEEVIGTSGEAPESVTLVDGPSSADTVTIRDNSKVVWLSQTTLSVDETLETVRKLEERFPNLIAPPSDDICYATQNRQIAVKAISAQADIVIVIGSKNSSNSGRLVEVALGAGAGKAYLVDSAAEIDEDWLLGVETVGLTSGASVPEILVEEVIRWLSQRGFSDVELVSSAVEHQRFALPRELLRARDRPPRS